MQAPLRVSSDHERRYRGSSKPATETVIDLLRTGDLAVRAA